VVWRYNYDGGEDYDGERESLGEGGFCRPYGGVACSPYIGNKVVYVSEKFRFSQVEESLRGMTITVVGCQMLVWRSVNGVRHISEVTLRRARLVLRWVTVGGYIVFVYNHCTQAKLASYRQRDAKYR